MCAVKLVLSSKSLPCDGTVTSNSYFHVDSMVAKCALSSHSKAYRNHGDILKVLKSLLHVLTNQAHCAS